MRELTYYQMLVSPKIGGAANVALAVGEYVKRTGSGRSRVLAPREGVAQLVAQERGLSCDRYDLDRLLQGSRLAVAIESMMLLRKTAFSSGIFHVHSPVIFGATRLFRQLSGLKSVLHIHLDFEANDLRWALILPPELTIVCAEFMRPAVLKALGDAGHQNCAVRVIRNAVDLDRFEFRDKALAKKNIGANEFLPLAMIIANISPHKGQMTCIRAVAELRRRGLRVQLWVVGECREQSSSYGNDLRAACADYGVEDLVRFTGFRSDVEDLMRAADFVLLPSISEGLPLSILEAQASGAVVLAAPTAGIPEVVRDNKTGFLIEADDPGRYASTIERLVSDASKMCELRNAARRYVEEEHDLQRYCGQVVAEYEGLLNMRPVRQSSKVS